LHIVSPKQQLRLHFKDVKIQRLHIDGDKKHDIAITVEGCELKDLLLNGVRVRALEIIDSTYETVKVQSANVHYRISADSRLVAAKPWDTRGSYNLLDLNKPAH
jgi:hypothetical protein